MTRRRSRRPSDPFAALGLAPDATEEQIRDARNRLAKRQHPDVGGSLDAMQRINEAADAALAASSRRAAARAASRAPAPPPTRSTDTGERRSIVRRDHPSFTIEALPAEAFEALLIAGSVLGQIADDDPPYRLDVDIDGRSETWCRLDVVPDGGGSTVSLTVATSRIDVSVTDVRDQFVAELNQLDWGDDGPQRRLPV